jgi:uncharacterized protein YjeT (DUF2065 family)
MNRSAAARTVTALVLAAALSLGRPAQIVKACGPFFERAVFSFVQHPDLPLDRFATGDLGVIQSTYARSYLVVAYRYLMGRPLGAAERKAVLDLWKERREGTWTAAAQLERWLERRALVPSAGRSPTFDAFRRVPGSPFYDFLNCREDAFRRASTVLDGLIRANGPASPAVVDWTRAQDAVFANCRDGDARPAAAADGLPAGSIQERGYQVAAAAFYALRFDDAEAQFRRIAADDSSPYRTLAPYLVARTLIRRATLLAPEGEIDRETMARADAQLASVIRDPALSAHHSAARSLRGFVRFRLDAPQRFHELAAALTAPSGGANASADFKQDLADFTLLLDKGHGDDLPASQRHEAAWAHDDDIADWILSFQADTPDAYEHAVRRWQETGSTPWLIAAISKMRSASVRPAVLAAAKAVQAGAPGFTSAAYHAARLAIEAGQTDQARTDLDALVTTRVPSMPPSAVNQFLALRMGVASSLAEFLRFAVRHPAGSYDGDDRTSPFDTPDTRVAKIPGGRTFDADATAILNARLPLDQLAGIAGEVSLQSDLRRRIAIAAWTRAVLLGRDSVALGLVSVVAGLEPALSPELAEYAATREAAPRALAGLATILRFPGMQPSVDAGLAREASLGRIDGYRDNWWCALPPAVGPQPLFLTTADQQSASSEHAALAAFGTAPDHLAAEAVRLAKLLPADPRSPEILHLAVRSTRYGCTDARTGEASHAAFALLHQRYPDSPWTKQTPYWYAGR